MAKKLILKTEIKRKKGKLYYCGTEDGMVAIFETDMAHPGKKEDKEDKGKKK